MMGSKPDEQDIARRAVIFWAATAAAFPATAVRAANAAPGQENVPPVDEGLIRSADVTFPH
ncbi:hypothetical protein LV478_12390 [Komagataeibacter oboediens]|uniref:hypothetical protein n=1 Tax=Komagataeibacter oboediens TaxID=65958 RepID=UPI0023DA66A1|nr:hypothetical protein [Komagataeibacter oboediens]WEQ51328.1 hypothetical protein LV478_12390 [Komagataeibacter oboediens]